MAGNVTDLFAQLGPAAAAGAATAAQINADLVEEETPGRSLPDGPGPNRSRGSAPVTGAPPRRAALPALL